MSLSVFINDLCSESLNMERLGKIFNHYNLQNKSPLIDPLTHSLANQFKLRSTRESIPLGDVSIDASIVERMCKRFKYEVIRKSIPKVTPLLESLNGTYPSYESCKINVATDLVFKPKDGNPSEWVATRVFRTNKLYPLKREHINVCISNGWYYETELDGIDCPFRIK